MKIDFKNYDSAGNFPEYFQVAGEIKAGKFRRSFKRSYFPFDDEEEEEYYTMKFTYCFDFIYKNKIKGRAFVYHGGYYIEFNSQGNGTYLSSHCSHFSIPMCRHYTSKGQFTQFFIDRIDETLNDNFENVINDEVGAITRQLNREKAGKDS